MEKKVIVGLGNPGDEYRTTYHNVGQMALRALVAEFEKEGIALEWKGYRDLYRYAETDDHAFILPLTFMNESGTAVREALKKYHATSIDLVLLHDESDLPVGEYKISSGQGSAGHKGVQSVIDILDTNDFTRVRIGIRDPQERGRRKAENFVLHAISPKDQEALQAVFVRIASDLSLS